MQRVREGFVLVRNPRNPAHVMRVSLSPHDVIAVVFWSRDYGRLIPHLAELDDRGLRPCFHLTLTDYGPPFELRAPATQDVLAQFEALSRRYDSRRVIWRYDPILLGSRHDPAHHVDRFERLASRIAPYASSCIISFLDLYPSTLRGLDAVREATGESFDPPSLAQRLGLASALLEVARAHHIDLRVCCEPDMLPSVPRARCIDPDLIRTLAADPNVAFRDAPTRKCCGCVLARDIGSYHTCAHGCVYCYACESPARALRNAREVDLHANALGPHDLEPSEPPRRSAQLPLANIDPPTRR